MNQSKETNYVNCISLGWFCGVASSLSKLGLRSFSGPFDWIISDYHEVLQQIESGFDDFLTYDNLRQDYDYSEIKRFVDVKHGFVFPHDINNSLCEEYETVKEKYDHRIELFYEKVTGPTCFFRCIRNREEIDYINDNWKHAETLLKSFCTDNHVIYMLLDSFTGLTSNVESYQLRLDRYYWRTYEMIKMFDSSEELLGRCHGFLDKDTVRKNRRFDKYSNGLRYMIEYFDECMAGNVEGIERLILRRLNAANYDDIYLWGAGYYGLRLANYLRNRGFRIKGLIDNNVLDGIKEGYRVFHFEELRKWDRVFIAVSDRNAYESICRQIEGSNKSVVYAGFPDLYDSFRLTDCVAVCV